MKTALARIRSSSRIGIPSFFSGRTTSIISAVIGPICSARSAAFAKDSKVRRTTISRFVASTGCGRSRSGTSRAFSTTGEWWAAAWPPFPMQNHTRRRPRGAPLRSIANGTACLDRLCRARKTVNPIASFTRCRRRRRSSRLSFRRAIAQSCWSAALRAFGRGPTTAHSK